jgi:hypothetical protein
MINFNIILSLSFCLYIQFAVFSQDISSELKDEVQKNLIAYQIKYFIDDNYFCVGEFESEIKSRFFTEENEEYDLTFVRNKDIEYSDYNIHLFVIYNNYYSKKVKSGNRTNEVSFTHSIDGSFFDRISRKILVGYNENNSKIIYISGNVFKNCIAQDFDLNKEKPEAFIHFLKFKLFNYDIKKISFKKRRKKYLLFKAYSEVLNKEIYIKIDSKNFDMLQVKTVLDDWTEGGSYSWDKNKWCN